MAELNVNIGDLEITEDEAAQFDDVQLARDGINKFLNEQLDEALTLFEERKDESPLMQAGYSFVYSMQGLRSNDDKLMDRALKVLEETEKKCEVSNGAKFMKQKSNKKNGGQQIRLQDKIQRQIIVGDSLLLQAMLVFTGQDIPSYVKGGWILRKAWKIYEKVYKVITKLRNNSKSKKSEPSPGESNDNAEEPVDGSDDHIPSEVLDRLQGAVNFGFGAFQITISLIPPKILKVMEFLGFEGDRALGIEALEFSSDSDAMFAPMATLALLMYHAFVRPFYGLDGINGSDTGCDDAERLIQSKECQFPNSCLFLYFRGRIHRVRRQLDLALKLYNEAYNAAKGQKEYESMCAYEIGWSNMMKLNWKEALPVFSKLKADTKWSKCFYTYMEAVCLGGMGDIKGAQACFKDVPGLMKKKNNQLQAYVTRRAKRMKKVPPTQEYCRLLLLELITLWHSMPFLSEVELRLYLDVCDMQTDHDIFHVKCLIEGAIYNQLGEEEMALQCLDECLARYSGMKDDSHIPPFVLFEMASIYMRKPETCSKAKPLLLEIKEKHKDYDFENSLVVRVNNALRHMKSK